MFRKIEDFNQTWAYQSGATKKIFEAVSEEAKNTAVCDGHRTLARIAWHIVTTIPEMAGRTGLKIEGPEENDPPPETMDDIRKSYEIAADSLRDQVEKNWNDEDLLKEDDMYGEMWKRGSTLLIIIYHEIHHRGQMTVLLRQAGIKVPGVYGPAKEEWAAFGATPPEV